MDVKSHDQSSYLKNILTHLPLTPNPSKCLYCIYQKSQGWFNLLGGPGAEISYQVPSNSPFFPLSVRCVQFSLLKYSLGPDLLCGDLINHINLDICNIFTQNCDNKGIKTRPLLQEMVSRSGNKARLILKLQSVGLRREWTVESGELENLNEYNFQVPPPPSLLHSSVPPKPLPAEQLGLILSF